MIATGGAPGPSPRRNARPPEERNAHGSKKIGAGDPDVGPRQLRAVRDRGLALDVENGDGTGVDERWEVHQPRRLDARESLHRFLQPVEERAPGIEIRVLRLGEIEAEAQRIARLVAGVDAHDCKEASEQKSGAHEKYKGEGDLHYREQVPQPTGPYLEHSPST